MYVKIKNYENYSINEEGNVINEKGKQLKPQLLKSGYLQICLRKNKKLYLHRILFETFVEPIKDNYTIDHIDNNKLNNHISNLQQMTQKENYKKFYDIIICKNVKGFKPIPDISNYYINKHGVILSFKHNKLNGRVKIPLEKDFIRLQINNKETCFKITDLINITFKNKNKNI